MLVRTDIDVEKIGVQAQLMEDVGVLQMGTGGRYKGVHFTLCGRVRMQWAQGLWNEWFAWCDDGRTGWLAEAQGFYSFYLQLEGEKVPTREEIKRGSQITLKDVTYKVDDIKEATVLGSEGELPFRAPAGRVSLSCDLNGPNGATATIEYSDKETRVFVGEYLEFDDLKLTHLKSLDGW